MPEAATRPIPTTAPPTPAAGLNRRGTRVRPTVAVEIAEKVVSVSQEDIDALTKRINEAADLEEEKKKEALERLKGAADWLKTATEAEAKIKEYQAEIETVPADLEATKAALAVPAGEPQFPLPAEATSAQVQQHAVDADTRLKAARETLAKREDALKRRGERKAELTKLAAEIEQRLEEARKQLTTDAAESSLVGAARHTETKARCIGLEVQKQLYPVELKRIDARAELLPLRRDLARREVTFLEKETAGWQKILADTRKRESDLQAEEARRQVQNAHPALKSVAEKNAELAERRKAMIAGIEKIETETQSSKELAEQLRAKFDKVTEKVEKAGKSTATGFLLRRQRDQLPDVSAGRDRIRFVQQETPKVHLSALDLQDARDALGDLDAVVTEVASQLDGAIRHYSPQYVSQMIFDLLQSRRDMLDNLIRDHDRYINLLGELELSQKELLDQRERFAAYIDERVLWIRSSEPIGRADFHNAAAGLRALASRAKWLGIVGAVRTRAAAHIPRVLLGIVAVAFLMLCRDRLRHRVDRICATDESVAGRRFAPTVEALAAAALATAFWPGLLWAAGWLLLTARGMPELGRACGIGLQSAVFALWIAQFSQLLLRRNGLTQRHFGWDGEGLSVVRGHLAWLSLLGVPLVFFVSAVTAYEDGQGGSSLGRIAFLTGCLLLFSFSHLVLRPQGGAFRQGCRAAPDAWFCRLRFTFYIFGIGIPLALAMFSALGFDYSAQRLAVRLQTTLAVALAVLLVRVMAIRWLSIRRERLEGELAAAREAALPEDAAASCPAKAHDETGIAQPSWEELAGEIEQSDAQVRYLLRYVVATVLLVGVCWIWADVTPALGVLDKVELWSKWIDVKETVLDTDGIPKVVTTPTEVATTLNHAILAALILMFGLVLARNLPALLDVLVLERMPVDKGQRYAAGMILRYIVTLGGLVAACKELGFTWGGIQWLAAAMTVGLGFGLQEIFANLVSGLIILFERPVRVGDLVTVGGVSGRVTRMQIRATTITDFDRRELIVPNKKFITEDVMNWTLTDNVNRIVIEVGIAYGSDTALARERILRVAHRHPLVLDDPEPTVGFDRFSDSSLNFTLRCFLPNLDHRLAVIHELHSEINRELAQANIEIAFPQQDLHIRTIDAPLLRDQQQKDAA